MSTKLAIVYYSSYGTNYERASIAVQVNRLLEVAAKLKQ